MAANNGILSYRHLNIERAAYSAALVQNAKSRKACNPQFADRKLKKIVGGASIQS